MAGIVTVACQRNPARSSNSNDIPTRNYYWSCLSAL